REDNEFVPDVDKALRGLELYQPTEVPRLADRMSLLEDLPEMFAIEPAPGTALLEGLAKDAPALTNEWSPPGLVSGDPPGSGPLSRSGAEDMFLLGGRLGGRIAMGFDGTTASEEVGGTSTQAPGPTADLPIAGAQDPSQIVAGPAESFVRMRQTTPARTED